jgi:hypothetical protein
MKDVGEKIKKVLRHNQMLALAAVVCIALLIYLVGCASSVTSPINPPKKVTRVQLDAEVVSLRLSIPRRK